MIKKRLNSEQRKFAADNHGLVCAFLNKNRLADNDYYDIVLFGYLKAVVKYLTKQGLKDKYAFSTIAYRSMLDSLSNHRKYQNRQKRSGVTISLESLVSDESTLSFHEVIPGVDTLSDEFETKVLLHEIALRVNRQQIQVVILKADGYGIRDIARKQKITMKEVRGILDSVKQTIYSVCRAQG